jgi:hypothetical protein
VDLRKVYQMRIGVTRRNDRRVIGKFESLGTGWELLETFGIFL